MDAQRHGDFPTYAAPVYQFDTIPGLSRLATRARLSQSAIDGFFAIMEKWQRQRCPQRYTSSQFAFASSETVVTIC